MSGSVEGYNVTLGEESPTFTYAPLRDGDVTQGWNSSYTQSATYVEGSTGNGIAFRRTQLDGASVTLSFEGTALYLCLTNQGSSYDLTLDGQPVTATADPTDAACSAYGAQTMAVADGLPYALHTAVLTVAISNPADATFQFFGGVATISVGPAGSTVSPPVYADSVDPGWEYSGGWWYNWSDPLDHGGYRTYCCWYDGASTAAYTVNNTSAVLLLGDITSNTYGYTVSLDNANTAYNASNYWFQHEQVLFFAGGLDPTESHTIVLANYNANQPNGPPNNTACVNLVSLVAIKSNPAASSSTTSTVSSTTSSTSPSLAPSSNSAPSHSGAIAGGVVGGIAVISLLAIVVFLLLRKRDRGGLAQFQVNDIDPDEPHTAITPYTDYPQTAYELHSKTSRSGPAPSSSSSVPRPSFSQFSSGSGGIEHSRSGSAAPFLQGGVPPQGWPTPQKSRRVPVPIVSDQAPSPDSTRTAQGPALAPALHEASTVDLVQILNQRLRAEQADNVEEPPEYANP